VAVTDLVNPAWNDFKLRWSDMNAETNVYASKHRMCAFQSMNADLVFEDADKWEDIKTWCQWRYYYRAPLAGTGNATNICPTCSQVVPRPVVNANSPPPYEAGASKANKAVGGVNESHEGQVNHDDDDLGFGF
jgi:hypothetical protein